MTNADFPVGSRACWDDADGHERAGEVTAQTPRFTVAWADGADDPEYFMASGCRLRPEPPRVGPLEPPESPWAGLGCDLAAAGVALALLAFLYWWGVTR